MLKRTISFLLALCLCIGITAGTEVYAGDDKGTNDEENVGMGKMEDINYTTYAGLGFSSGKYRIIRINCPVDVTVCDADGNVLTTIINDTPQKDGELVAAFNEDGEKLVYLPVNEDYMVKLTATGDGTMNYGIQEIDPQAGESNHIVNFNDILISKGQEYVAYLPGYSLKEIEDGSGEAAKTKYTLFLDDTQILPDEELSGKDAFDAYYYVDAVSADETNGYVFGGGTHQLGTFTKLTAVAKQGYEFVGWYADQELVSKETEYRIRVSKDVKLVAVFKPIEEGIKIYVCVLLFAIIFLVGSCWDRELTLEKIAYDRSAKDYTVYLKENGEYVPYLALSSNYNGNVLLLRKNLLPDLMPYKKHGKGWATHEYGS